MSLLRSKQELLEHYEEISAYVHEHNEPVYIADENGDYLEELADEDEYDEIYGIYLDAGE